MSLMEFTSTPSLIWNVSQLIQNEENIQPNALCLMSLENIRDTDAKKISESGILSTIEVLFIGDPRNGGPNLYFSINNKITFAKYRLWNDTSISFIQLYDAYQAQRYLPINWSKIGRWTPQHRLVMESMDEFNRRKNLTGLHLRCVTLGQAPFTILSDGIPGGPVKIEGGFIKEVFEDLKNEFHFTYSCRRPRDEEFGTLRNGVWSGLIREVNDGWADIIVTSLDVSSQRREAVDFLVPLRMIGSKMVIERPGFMATEWESFINELNLESWLATISLILIAPIFLSYITKNSPCEQSPISLEDSYLLAFGAIAFQGSWLNVNSSSSRIAFISIFLGTLLIYSYYTGALVAELTITSGSMAKFETLEELLEDGSYDLGVRKGSSVESFFKQSKVSPYKEIWNGILQPNLPFQPISDQAGITNVENGRYVFMMPEDSFKFDFGERCDLIMLPTEYFRMATGMAISRNSPFKKMFDAHILKLRNSGILKRYWDKWKPSESLCEEQPLMALTLKQVSTALAILFLGVVLSILVCLPLEIIVNLQRTKRNRETENDKISQKKDVLFSNTYAEYNRFTAHRF